MNSNKVFAFYREGFLQKHSKLRLKVSRVKMGKASYLSSLIYLSVDCI